MTYSRFRHMYGEDSLLHPLTVIVVFFIVGWVSGEYYHEVLSSKEWADRIVIAFGLIVILDPIIKSIIWIKDNFRLVLKVQHK